MTDKELKKIISIVDKKFINEVSDAVGYEPHCWDLTDPEELCINIILVYLDKVSR